ncbi:AMP-binding protein [Methylomonas sp. SURF-2]|uniref:AMP-binding protein n=1 Tax=Methylomonas subterranea TaxID=2952225 RepID=A0ABT1TJ99_9GAMM|nr:AMP-binding protein [Methylomonas sp. SURF-2]MCQ8105545.1 AMP-binding protein [Methylomonas sp. SURF-2]
MKNIYALLQQAAVVFPERIALVERIQLRDERWSYRHLNQVADRMAEQLVYGYDFRPGTCLLLRGRPNPQLVAAYFACFKAGIVVVPIDPHLSIDFITRVAESTQAGAMLGNDQLPGFDALPQLSVAALADTPSAHADFNYRPQPDDIAEIVFTSGTTSNPKGVVLSHRNILSSVNAIQDIYPKQRSLRFLSLLPLSHLFEQTAGLFAPLLLGATIYFSGNFQSEVVMRKLEAKCIDGVIAVPQMLEMIWHALENQIVESGGQTRWRLWRRFAERLPFAWRRVLAQGLFPAMAGTPVFFVSGGASLPVNLERHWELLGVRVIQGYGTTECAPVISVNRYDDRIAGSVGWPVAGVTVTLSEQDEILVRGPNVSRGYWQNPAATRQVFSDAEGYRTGDLGAFGARGELYIKGRSKDMIVLANGLNVFPEDIELELGKQPGIGACMVTDLLDRHGRQCIAAILCFPEPMPEEERQRRAQEAVRNANAALAPHQRISDIRYWTGDFPRTPLLKIQRWKVKSRFVDTESTQDAVADTVTIRTRSASIEQLLANVCRVDIKSINDQTDLVLDLGCDSLTRVELAGLIEAQLGIICDDAELIAIREVGELKALLGRSERTAKKMRFPRWPLSELAVALRGQIQGVLLPVLQGLVTSSFEIKGLEHLTQARFPVMFIANHASHVDTLSILRAMPWTVRRRLCIAAAADYFFSKKLIAGLLSLSINAFAFSRDGSIRGSLEHCGELIDNGWSLLIYPEGTRSPDGQLLRFKPGIGYLATELGVPVIPVAISGGHKILPKGTNWPVRSPVRVHFGAAIHIAANMDKQQATDFLHACLANLIAEQQLSLSHA